MSRRGASARKRSSHGCGSSPVTARRMARISAYPGWFDSVSHIHMSQIWIPSVSAFKRVHSPSKTGVNALNDALCAGMSGKEAMTFRWSPRGAPGDARVEDPELRIVPAIAIDRFVIAITSSEARCWHAAHVQSAGAVRQGKGRDKTSACFRRKQREMSHVEKHHRSEYPQDIQYLRGPERAPLPPDASQAPVEPK